MRGGTSLAKKCLAVLTAALFLTQAGPSARAYVLTYTVADMRQPNAQSGGSACPKTNHFNITSGPISRRWSTSLGTSPVIVFTQDQTLGGSLNEIESTILESFSIWTGVAGTKLASSTLAPLGRAAAQAACNADGLNTICFNQNDLLFTRGVLAFTRVITSDVIGAQPFPNHPPSAFIGEILDADILLRPGDGSTTFATPQALPNHPGAYDLESVLAHELGHFFGFGHSGVWRAMMYPFAPPTGQFLVDRPTGQVPDGPLSDDDRVGLRVLYADPNDTLNIGSISGRIVPANSLSLPAQPSGVTGIFGAHVVAVDNTTGGVVAGTFGGWSCGGSGPPQFDGAYMLEHLPVGANRSYRIYVEPLDGPVDGGDISGSTALLCRNETTDPGWPQQFACRVPDATINFTTRTRPVP